MFFKSKDETINEFVKFSKKVENKKGFSIINIWSNHSGKLICDLFEFFVKKKDITITFQYLELLNKIGLQKGKISLFQKWQEQC